MFMNSFLFFLYFIVGGLGCCIAAVIHLSEEIDYRIENFDLWVKTGAIWTAIFFAPTGCLLFLAFDEIFKFSIVACTSFALSWIYNRFRSGFN